jgi:transmembrane sensor
MASSSEPPAGDQPSPHEHAAADALARQHLKGWTSEEAAAIGRRKASDVLFADAVRRVEQSVQAVEAHASAPELIRFREQALARARRANGQRWLRSAFQAYRWRWVASLAGLGLIVAAFQFSPWGYRPGQVTTHKGEQRVLELQDRSRIVLDASTRLRVRFTDDVRVVDLLEGQAQFSIGGDPRRPFKVQAGAHTLVALGTEFTVAYIDDQMSVSMLEGTVSVAAQPAARTENTPVLLSAGQALRVNREGTTTIIPKADLEAATAWRKGKVIFRNEPLGEAVRRMNRYSEVQLEIDAPELAHVPFSGVFEAGDARTFAEGVQMYLPVTLDTSDPHTIRVRKK